jgi:protein O-mannosyl-transferase
MNPRWLHGLICLALVGVTLICMGHVLANDFINIDDPHYVTSNAIVQSGLNWISMTWAWTTTHAGFWMPLTWISLELDAALYWPAAWGFHLTNLLLHLANTLLAYGLMWRLTGKLGISALIAALFAIHPLHVESVAWITERKDVLSCFFGLLALLAYLRYRAGPSVWRMAAVALLFELSLLAKPVLVTLPALMLVLDWWQVSEPAAPARDSKMAWWTRRVLEKLPLFGLSLACTLITIETQHTIGATSLVRLPLKLRLANAVVSYERYLAKTFWPVDLAVYYPHPGGSLTLTQISIASLLLIAITGLAFVWRKSVPAVLVGWLWFIGCLAPNIGLIQAGGQAMADRFSYFALLGLFLALVAGADVLARRLQVAATPRIALALVVIIGLGTLTFAQVGLWKNCATLYTHTLAVTEDNGYIHELLGIYYHDHGEWELAEEQLGKAIDMKMAFTPNAYLYYGSIKHRKKEWLSAAENLEIAVQLQPKLAIAHYFLGDTLLHLGARDPAALVRAEKHLAQAAALQPSFAQAYLSLAMVQDRRGHRTQARNTIDHALDVTADPQLREKLEEYLRTLK